MGKNSSSFAKYALKPTGTVRAFVAKALESKRKILVVEDNPDTLQLMVLVLSREGYQVAEAVTGYAALDQARTQRPDLIFMDLGLPGINGDEATVLIKSDPAINQIPIIVDTAFNADAPIVQRAEEAGAAEVLHKPVPLTLIKEVARRYLSPSFSIPEKISIPC
jgi:two-component system cell cycle response regulator DivK